MIEVHVKYPEVIYRYECPIDTRYTSFPNEYIISIFRDNYKITFQGLENSSSNIKIFTRDDIYGLVNYISTIPILDFDKIRYSIIDIEFRPIRLEKNVFT
jgi:hypothetical protein